MLVKRLLIVLVLCSLVTGSCSGREDQSGEQSTGELLPVDDMNAAFVIEDRPVLENSHGNGERLAFVLRNISDQAIVFPPDYDLQILMHQNQNWEPVQNLFQYTGIENELPTFDVFPPGRVVIAYPYVPDLSEPTVVRFVMVGHFENSKTEVAAYIDITIFP